MPFLLHKTVDFNKVKEYNNIIKNIFYDLIYKISLRRWFF